MSDDRKALLEECKEDALSRIASICEENGLTMENVVRTLAEALNATEVKPIKTTVYGDDGKPKQHRIRYTKKLVAWGPRLEAAKTSSNLLRMMPKQQVELSGTVDHQHEHELSPEIQEKLNEVYEQSPGP